MRSASILAALALLTASFALAHPMVSPEIDIEKPFCYYSRPTDQLGTMDSPKGFMVTAEGYLYNRAAELMFMYGPKLDLVQPQPLFGRQHLSHRQLFDGEDGDKVLLQDVRLQY